MHNVFVRDAIHQELEHKSFDAAPFPVREALLARAHREISYVTEKKSMTQNHIDVL